MRRLYLLAIAALLPFVCSCEKEDNRGSGEIPYVYPDAKGDQIPDFSHVGYHWGDDDPVTPPVVKTLYAPQDGSDMTAAIQKAIDETPSTGGTIRLTAGVYNVKGTIYLNKNGVVLRGDGQDRTRIVATRVDATQSPLITLGSTNSWGRVVDEGSKVKIAEDYVPLGRMYVDLENASSFSKGDNVVLFRPASAKWIHDIKMDQIPPGTSGPSVQWDPEDYKFYFERKVLKIEGNRVWLDNPVAMSMDAQYGGGYLMKYSSVRASECGVENMELVSTYASLDDELHAWIAVEFNLAEHCWARDLTMRYFAYCAAIMHENAKNITVDNCKSYSPISVSEGSRKYAFHIAQGQLCLVKNCWCEKDRHQYVTGKANGPNVFYNCVSVEALEDCGPHQRWAMATLYDNVNVDGKFRIQDRGYMGTGHGWAGANLVMWNCSAGEFVCQSPWTSAKNWAIGCVGPKSVGSVYVDRPQGEWISRGVRVSPSSLYEAQKKSKNHVNVWAELGGKI